MLHHASVGQRSRLRARIAWPCALSALAIGLGLTASASAAERTVTVVLSEEPDVLEPCQSSRSNIGRVVKQNIVETLVEIDPKDGQITPRLATAWQQVDANTWRFTLREGVKFHDGAAFDAAAAVKSIDRTLHATPIECEIRTKFFGGLKITAKAVDATTLELVTDKPAPILPTMMGTMTITSPSSPMDKATNQPIGTGPYKLDEWKVGQEITLSRFDGYWGPKPQAERARYVWRTESTVRAAMIAAGEADIAANIAVQDATDPKMDFSYPNSETSRLRIDTTRPPLDDRRVRMALNYAIDRGALRGSIFSADVEPSTQLVVPSINGHNPELKVWPYDPDKAMKLLAEARAAGVPVDNEIMMIGRINIYPNATEAMEAMHAMLQAVGLNVKLKMLEVAEWVNILQKPYADDRGPVLLQAQHDNNNGDAVFTVYNKYHCEGANSTICDKKLDQTIEAAEKATGDERRKLWQEAFRIIGDDIIADVPLFHMVGYTRVGSRVNFQPSISTNSELHIEDITFK
ncbi:MAG: peptide ABC transporter substrate-binding protein [Ectothiorhodospiraceae bacterium]|nr:peptide ABC transporter substrate-binding protein [Ectothiorhodospiraceae bacterium]